MTYPSVPRVSRSFFRLCCIRASVRRFWSVQARQCKGPRVVVELDGDGGGSPYPGGHHEAEVLPAVGVGVDFLLCHDGFRFGYLNKLSLFTVYMFGTIFTHLRKYYSLHY